MRDKCKAAFKLFLIVVWLMLSYAALFVAKLAGSIAWRDRIIMVCNQGLLVIVGVRLKVTGELAKERPLLLVTNHISYLDVIVIAACAVARFTPKSEIGGWPFIGGFCRLCGSVFIDRRPEQVGKMKELLHGSLDAGNAVVLFPEATTGNGVRVKEFKSGFFNLAKDDFSGRSLWVQPAAVIYTHIGGLPIDTTQWPMIAWYGDMDLAPHLWQVLMLPGITAELVFLPPIDTQGNRDRKKLAVLCQAAIAEAIEAARQKQVAVPHGKGKTFNPSSLRKK